MKVEHVPVVRTDGERVVGTKVSTTDKKGMRVVVLYPEKLSNDQAIERTKKFIRNPPSRKVLAKSLRSFKRFNWKDASRLVRKSIDLKTPFIRIGEVPLITYMSDKEGKTRAYKHETKIMPTLYMHPSKPIGLLVGGSLKVKEWLED